MEVKPVGRERDAQIAELRKDRVLGDCSDRACMSVEMYLAVPNLSHCPRCESQVVYRYKSYSTSLTDAWPLWEEMKETGHMVELFCNGKGGGTYCQIHIFTYAEEYALIDWQGEDEPDAISGNWVKWKGEDNENQS